MAQWTRRDLVKAAAVAGAGRLERRMGWRRRNLSPDGGVAQDACE